MHNFSFVRRLFAKHYTLSSWCRIFSSRSRSPTFGFKRFERFLFIAVAVISIVLKTAIHSQSLVKILWRSDKDKITFNAIEKDRYGLRETVSKHLKSHSTKENLICFRKSHCFTLFSSLPSTSCFC